MGGWEQRFGQSSGCCAWSVVFKAVEKLSACSTGINISSPSGRGGGMTTVECGISSGVRSGVACLGAILWH